jgi:2'-5' RNA ligase
MPRAIEAYSYGCLMAMLPESVARRVRGFAALIPDCDIYDDGSGEHGRENDPHITVKYGLHTGDGQFVAEIMGSQSAPTARLGGMSVFENDKYTVLKIDVDSPDLHALNQFVDASFETNTGFPVYHPHATIAYLRKGCDWRRYVCDIFHGSEMRFDEILFSSADNVETVVPLKMPRSQKVARVASRVANHWIDRLNIADQFPDKKTEMQVKVQLAFDGDDLDAEYRAQQAFLQTLAGLGVRKAEIVAGGVNTEGYGVS